MRLHSGCPVHLKDKSSFRRIYSASLFSKQWKRKREARMSQELPGSFGVMFPTFSLPMKAERSRNKERLEASLTGLCELELLKQRQECRVLSALCLGDSPVPRRPLWGALRSAHCTLDAPQNNASDDRLQTSSLQCMPRGIKASLEQQVAELKVNTEVKSGESLQEDGQLSSGEVFFAKQSRFPESNYHPVVPFSLSPPEATGKKEAGETWLSEPTRQTTISDSLGVMTDVDQQARKVETYIFGLIQRRALLTRPSKPRTSLAHEGQTGRAVCVVRQSSLCRKEEQDSSKLISIQEISSPPQCSEGTAQQVCHNLDQERNLGTGFTEDASPLNHHNLQQAVQHQPGLYHRPKQASMINSSRSTLLDYPSFRALQVHPDSSNSEPDSPQHFHKYPSPPVLTKPHQPPSPDEQLVSAEYIPAQPCRAFSIAYAHHPSYPHRSSLVSKTNRSTYSPERGLHHHEQQPTTNPIQPSRSRGGPKKCRLNDDRSGVSRKPGKKACRSQSENSLQRIPERKYNTVERDGGGSGSGGKGSHSCQSRGKKQQHGGGSHRHWRSTQELSQDEADQPSMQAPMQSTSASNQKDHCGRRTRKFRPTHALYAYPHHHYHHHQHIEYQFERDQVLMCQPTEDYPHPGQAESESSMSEPDSPDSSSLSSDSDESCGLVWPQQLSPPLSLPTPPVPPGVPLQPKAFVKIKASHALKKKILRFRTGSLKVMTTV